MWMSSATQKKMQLAMKTTSAGAIAAATCVILLVLANVHVVRSFVVCVGPTAPGGRAAGAGAGARSGASGGGASRGTAVLANLRPSQLQTTGLFSGGREEERGRFKLMRLHADRTRGEGRRRRTKKGQRVMEKGRGSPSFGTDSPEIKPNRITRIKTRLLNVVKKVLLGYDAEEHAEVKVFHKKMDKLSKDVQKLRDDDDDDDDDEDDLLDEADGKGSALGGRGGREMQDLLMDRTGSVEQLGLLSDADKASLMARRLAEAGGDERERGRLGKGMVNLDTRNAGSPYEEERRQAEGGFEKAQAEADKKALKQMRMEQEKLAKAAAKLEEEKVKAAEMKARAQERGREAAREARKRSKSKGKSGGEDAKPDSDAMAQLMASMAAPLPEEGEGGEEE